MFFSHPSKREQKGNTWEQPHGFIALATCSPPKMGTSKIMLVVLTIGFRKMNWPWVKMIDRLNVHCLKKALSATWVPQVDPTIKMQFGNTCHFQTSKYLNLNAKKNNLGSFIIPQTTNFIGPLMHGLSHLPRWIGGFPQPLDQWQEGKKSVEQQIRIHLMHSSSVSRHRKTALPCPKSAVAEDPSTWMGG